jgi:hypothetical protein
MLSSSPRGTGGMPFAAQLRDLQADWLSRRVTLLEQRMDRVENAIVDLRGEMNRRFELVDARFVDMQAQMDRRFDAVEQALISLQTLMMGLHNEAMRQMRVLHEDVIDRISKINRA